MRFFVGKGKRKKAKYSLRNAKERQRIHTGAWRKRVLNQLHIPCDLVPFVPGERTSTAHIVSKAHFQVRNKFSSSPEPCRAVCNVLAVYLCILPRLIYVGMLQHLHEVPVQLRLLIPTGRQKIPPSLLPVISSFTGAGDLSPSLQQPLPPRQSGHTGLPSI